MLYAKVVVGLPVEGPFDYQVPQGLLDKVKTGQRVRVSFGARRLIGYIVGLSGKTSIKNTKPILELIDDSPVLNKNLLLLTKELSQYYCCSWGEAIETALPQDLRRGKQITFQPFRDNSILSEAGPAETLLIHDPDGGSRWETYLDSIRGAYSKGRSSIILFSDINAVKIAQERISSSLGVPVEILYRKQPKGVSVWLKIRNQQASIVVGTRSAIFAPFENLGLIIIDEEQDSVYKQDQVPHYNARDVAFMRSKIDEAKLLLASRSPSLETLILAKKGKIKYKLSQNLRWPAQIQTIDTSKEYFGSRLKPVFSRYLQDAINLALNSQDKVLLFLNRKGFATSAFCRNCATALKCPRCNVNLVLYFKENVLSCHFCNYRITPPQICPNCNSSYIRYSGTGTEKIESELNRLFPQARIKRIKEHELLQERCADIFVATESIIKEINYDFGLIGMLSLDNLLNRNDFRASEKAFSLLVGLSRFTQKTMVIQTGLYKHHCLLALANRDLDIFYDQELKQRQELDFPPFKHLGLIKLRGKNEERVKEGAGFLFETLSKQLKNKPVKIISVNPGQPAKLRGNFYWQLLIKFSEPLEMSPFLKSKLKSFSHSGIIVTVDIDPV